MKSIKLTNLEYFNTADPLNGTLCHGHDQDWYRHWFRRLAGCGPTTASNMLLYEMLAGSLWERRGEMAGVDGRAWATAPTEGVGRDEGQLRGALGRSFPLDEDGSLDRMNYVWGFVTPSKRGGLNSTALFCDGIRALAAAVGLAGLAEALDVPETVSEGKPAARGIFGGRHPLGGERPSVGDIVAFIIEALEKDRPVAFLNLDNGAEKQLEKWHWVTIVGIDAEDEGRVVLDILDNCAFLKVDLNSWLGSTFKGGGFARFAFGIGD